MTILVIHAAVLILYGLIVWNSVQQGRQAAQHDTPNAPARGADGAAQAGEGPVGN
jgi:hypothetical protein